RCLQPPSGLQPRSQPSSFTICSRARSQAIARRLQIHRRKSYGSSVATSITASRSEKPPPLPRSNVMGIRLDHGKDELDEVHEINVTPFIDVIFVLLIIFMIAAPLATVDISVDLPSSTAQPQPRPEKPIYLTVKPDLSLALGETPVTREQLSTALAQTTNGDKQTRIFLRADKVVPYGELMEVINLLRAA